MSVENSFAECPSTFFLGLNGITLPIIGIPGLDVGGGLKVLRDPAAIGRMVGAYVDQIGLLEAGFLQERASAIVYAHDKVQLDSACAPQWINGLLIQHLSEVQNWLLKLWLIKDNAADPDVGWMAVRYNGDPIVNNNRWATAYSKADGTSDAVSFSRKELLQAMVFPFEAEDVSRGRPVPLYRSGASEQRVTKLSHNTLRVQRFIYFVNAARATRDVAIKIAHYCSGLEAMVSTSHTELTHQVAERVAILLHPGGQARLDTFRKVKEAYAMRSKAVHGAVFRERDHGRIVEKSVEIDQICREVLLAFLNSSDFQDALKGDDQAYADFWVRKLFL